MASDTTGPAPAVTEEMVAAGAQGVATGRGQGDLNSLELSEQQWLRVVTRNALRGALAGRTVVELPAPDGRSWAGASMWDAEARRIEARVDQQRRPFVRCDGKMWLVSEAEAVGLALVAAAREARRLASESSGDKPERCYCGGPVECRVSGHGDGGHDV